MNYLLLIFIGIIGVFYYNTFIWLINSWLYNPYYSHGFIVPIVSGFIIWRMRKELHDVEIKQSQTGLILFIIGILLQSIAVIWVIRSLSGLSLIITISGIILYIFGWEFLSKIKFPVLFLLLCIPIPFLDIVTPPIQTISVIISSSLANLIGIPVQISGYVLNTPSGSFEIALECSGLKSIISLLTISIIYAFMLEGSLMMKFTVALSSIPLALFGNILRIVSVLIISERYGKETALNYFHDFSSILLFSVALIGLFLVGRSFGRLRFKKIF